MQTRLWVVPFRLGAAKFAYHSQHAVVLRQFLYYNTQINMLAGDYFASIIVYNYNVMWLHLSTFCVLWCEP